jgi:hypothetical protein
MLLTGQPASASRFLEGGTGGLNEEKTDLVKSGGAAERAASHDNSRAAMPFALVIEGELDFRADAERPLGQEADSLGRPMNLFLNQID